MFLARKGQGDITLTLSSNDTNFNGQVNRPSDALESTLVIVWVLLMLLTNALSDI